MPHHRLTAVVEVGFSGNQLSWKKPPNTRRRRATAPADPETLGLGLGLGLVWADVQVRIDQKVLHEFICKVVLKFEVLQYSPAF